MIKTMMKETFIGARGMKKARKLTQIDETTQKRKNIKRVSSYSYKWEFFDIYGLWICKNAPRNIVNILECNILFIW